MATDIVEGIIKQLENIGKKKYKGLYISLGLDITYNKGIFDVVRKCTYQKDEALFFNLVNIKKEWQDLNLKLLSISYFIKDIIKRRFKVLIEDFEEKMFNDTPYIYTSFKIRLSIQIRKYKSNIYNEIQNSFDLYLNNENEYSTKLFCTLDTTLKCRIFNKIQNHLSDFIENNSNKITSLSEYVFNQKCLITLENADEIKI
jgi:hypothetical protein